MLIAQDDYVWRGPPDYPAEIKMESLAGRKLLLWFSPRFGLVFNRIGGALTRAGTVSLQHNRFDQSNVVGNSSAHFLISDPALILNGDFSAIITADHNDGSITAPLLRKGSSVDSSGGWLWSPNQFGPPTNLYGTNIGWAGPGVYGISSSGGNFYSYANGVFIRGVSPGAPANNTVANLGIMCDPQGGSLLSANNVGDVFVFSGQLDNDLMLALTTNPWPLLIQPEADEVWVTSGSGSAALAGNATDTASATGQLTTSLPFNGGAVSVATASGLFTNAIDFNGSASAGVNVAGDLFTQLKFDGASLADALAQATLTTGLPFLGAATGQAGGSGDFTVQLALLGAAVANALALGDLTGGASGFAGAAAAQAQALADLTTDIPLTGNPQAYASASGGLTTILPLNGVSAAVNNVTGDLTVALRFNAQALALALASAEFTVQIQFNGAALAQAAASGTLAGTAPQPSLNPRYVVEIEPRWYEAEIAPRLYEVAM